MSGQNCQVERRDKVLQLYRSGELSRLCTAKEYAALEGYYVDELTVYELAQRRGVVASTVSRNISRGEARISATDVEEC
jgi:predicted DNA-binding protein YlxM (UPF0122 family)